MIGLGNISSFEECLDILEKHQEYNGIVTIQLFSSPYKIYKEYFACDRFESSFDGILAGLELNEIKEIFNEPFIEIMVSYRLMPRGKRTEPLYVTTKITKKEISQLKDLNIEIELKIFETLYKELLYALIEGK